MSPGHVILGFASKLLHNSDQLHVLYTVAEKLDMCWDMRQTNKATDKTFMYVTHLKKTTPKIFVEYKKVRLTPLYC